MEMTCITFAGQKTCTKIICDPYAENCIPCTKRKCKQCSEITIKTISALQRSNISIISNFPKRKAQWSRYRSQKENNGRQLPCEK